MIPVFITGTGTGVGKTIVSVIVSNALQADYWKPVQAGNIDGTDNGLVTQLINTGNKCHAEVYNLSTPASPHIASRKEKKLINLNLIIEYYNSIKNNQSDTKYLVIEGAGGLLVPLNDQEFIIDLILILKAKVILVSRNYLGSINHSLLTSAFCRQRGADVVGWIFNDEYMQYQDEIAAWSGYPVIGSIPKLEMINREVLSNYTLVFREKLLRLLEKELL
jgi:dethiobiotin synthetase